MMRSWGVEMAVAAGGALLWCLHPFTFNKSTVHSLMDCFSSFCLLSTAHTSSLLSCLSYGSVHSVHIPTQAVFIELYRCEVFVWLVKVQPMRWPCLRLREGLSGPVMRMVINNQTSTVQATKRTQWSHVRLMFSAAVCFKHWWSSLSVLILLCDHQTTHSAQLPNLIGCQMF